MPGIRKIIEKRTKQKKRQLMTTKSLSDKKIKRLLEESGGQTAALAVAGTAATSAVGAQLLAGQMVTRGKKWWPKKLYKGRKIPEAPGVALSMARKYKLKRMPTIRYEAGKGYFDPKRFKVVSERSMPTVLHELGHAIQHAKRGRLAKKLAMPMYALGVNPRIQLLGLLAAPWALSEHPSGRYAPLASLALSSPMLAEEAGASIKALRHLKKLYGKKGLAKGLKRLGPAWLTYGLFASIAPTTLWAGRAMIQKHRRRKRRLERMRKQAASYVRDWVGYRYRWV